MPEFKQRGVLNHIRFYFSTPTKLLDKVSIQILNFSCSQFDCILQFTTDKPAASSEAMRARISHEHACFNGCQTCQRCLTGKWDCQLSKILGNHANAIVWFARSALKIVAIKINLCESYASWGIQSYSDCVKKIIHVFFDLSNYYSLLFEYYLPYFWGT